MINNFYLDWFHHLEIWFVIFDFLFTLRGARGPEVQYYLRLH